MRVRYFVVPAADPANAQDEVNRFLSQHRVLDIKHELVRLDCGGFWSVCVLYNDVPAVAKPSKGRGRVDYKEKLSKEDFAIYAALRELRKDAAEKQGVPPYAVFNNAQLAAMVEGRVRSVEDLGRIEGVGPSRQATYGTMFVDRLRALQDGERADAEPA